YCPHGDFLTIKSDKHSDLMVKKSPCGQYYSLFLLKNALELVANELSVRRMNHSLTKGRGALSISNKLEGDSYDCL
ncbi:hypothetical protein L4D21_23020, partial [Photobacterium profundum]